MTDLGWHGLQPNAAMIALSQFVLQGRERGAAIACSLTPELAASSFKSLSAPRGRIEVQTWRC